MGNIDLFGQVAFEKLEYALGSLYGRVTLMNQENAEKSTVSSTPNDWDVVKNLITLFATGIPNSTGLLEQMP